jgi:hypothetical protein
VQLERVRVGKRVERVILTWVGKENAELKETYRLIGGLHAVGSTMLANEQAAWHEQPSQTVFEHLEEADFWYESFQNWQSEFLSMGVLIVLGIFLRQKGSPESKPVAAPHHQTGR